LKDKKDFKLTIINPKKLKAYDNLLLRLNDVQLLLISYSKIQGPGYRSITGALYRAVIVLLCAQLEAFIEELYSESAHLLLDDYILDTQALINQALSSFSNPQPYRINRLFATIGFSDIINLVSWQGTNAKSITKKLSDYVELRNAIAHGKKERITKDKVYKFVWFVKLFAKSLQEWVNSLSVISDLGLPGRRSQQNIKK